MRTSLLFAAIIIAALPACTPVKPWEREKLSKSIMSFEPDPLRARMLREVADSKEASSGGYGLNSGGCGCN